MSRALLFIFFEIIFGTCIMAQEVVSGFVIDQEGHPLEGANVYLEGTYDGASTNMEGYFEFTSEEVGLQTLVVSSISYETSRVALEVQNMKGLKFQLKEAVSSLDTVVIAAGTFEAGDNSKVSVLKPLDVVTTASALGDFVGALQTLPGTSTVAEDGRLFVRGGDAGETQIFIDGIRVFTPYTPTTNNIPTRGRYSPFLFDGITFSTGGYSSEFGQALSSVLLLNTIDEPTQEKTDISIMSVGVGLGNTQKWENSSLSVNAGYFNLAPYVALFPDRNDWEKPFESFSGESVFRRKFDKGLVKFYAAFDATGFELTQEDINLVDGFYFKMRNNNFYSNVSFEGDLGNDWDLYTGASFTRAYNDLVIEDQGVENKDLSGHLKLKLRKRMSNRVKLYMGAEQFLTDYSENYSSFSISPFSYGFRSSITGVFAEGDLIFSKKFASKLGVRGEYNGLFNEFTFSPRVSLAYKTSKHGQLSLAYGDFYQQAFNEVLKYNQELESQKAQHYILNYQYSYNNRILRLEAFYKNYDRLVTYNEEFPSLDSDYGNEGIGYAQGLDLFWRDNQSIKNTDYWVSYSYLDSKRNYLHYPEEATPPIANTHNFSIVGKHWISDWRSQVGFSYTFASGRTFTNPNQPGFLNDRTKAFNNVSINWAYLLSQQKIVYFSINNVFAFNNVNGYQYANVPDENGNFDRRALRPAADQFFFVGFFWTLSDDRNDNQLDNL